MYFHTHRCLLDYQTQILVIAGTLLTLITNSNPLKIRNVTKGTYTTINCTYGEGEVRNLFWHPGNCSTPWIVRYLNGKVNSSDEPRFWLGDDNSTLILKNVSIEDEGTYCCSVDIKKGIVDPNELLTSVNVFGADAKTLPVIRQCQEDDHDDLNSTTCTLNAPTSLTCELHGIYPNRSVKLEWHGYEGAISSISKSYSNDDRTYTFLATIHVLEAGNFSCNASFPSEEGQVETGVPVTVTMVTDPANQINYVAIIVPVVAVAVLSVTVIVVRRYVMRYRRGKDQTPTRTPQSQIPLIPSRAAEAGSNTPHDSESRVPDHADEQERGNEPAEQTEEARTPQSQIPLIPSRAAEAGSNTPHDSESRVPDHADEQERGNKPAERSEEGTQQEIQHSTDESQCNIKIKDGQLIELSKKFPHQQYTNLCTNLLSYDEGKNILEKNLNNYKEAVMEVLMKWKHSTGGVCRVLCSALVEAEVGGTLKPLIHIAADPRTAEEQL